MSGADVQASALTHDDGSMTLSGPLGSVRVLEAECDDCGGKFPPADRCPYWDWARGSEYWAEVMWSCVWCYGVTVPRTRPVDMYDRDTEWEVW